MANLDRVVSVVSFPFVRCLISDRVSETKTKEKQRNSAGYESRTVRRRKQSAQLALLELPGEAGGGRSRLRYSSGGVLILCVLSRLHSKPSLPGFVQCGNGKITQKNKERNSAFPFGAGPFGECCKDGNSGFWGRILPASMFTELAQLPYLHWSLIALPVRGGNTHNVSWWRFRYSIWREK